MLLSNILTQGFLTFSLNLNLVLFTHEKSISLICPEHCIGVKQMLARQEIYLR